MRQSERQRKVPGFATVEEPENLEEEKQEKASLEEGKQCKEYCELNDVETWTESGWTKLHRVIRHALAPHKKMLRAATSKKLKQELEDLESGSIFKKLNIVNFLEGDLFAWLSFLDYNVMIILFLMLIIGIINVGSAMLVLIVMRTNFIGILKAMGATNWSIRKVFLFQASYLILKGLMYGNIIGVSLCIIQAQFGLFSLDPTVYYLDKVPVELTLFNWLGINLITFFVCITSLLLPSYVVTRISPSKAIRFN